MKQYMIKLKVLLTQEVNDQELYESEEHYFNTFFMVDEAFENIIELRNAVSNSKRYVRMRESFLYKTKIL
jgi:hypothetical protein